MHINDSFDFFKKFQTQCHQIEKREGSFSKVFNYIFVNEHANFLKKFSFPNFK